MANPSEYENYRLKAADIRARAVCLRDVVQSPSLKKQLIAVIAEVDRIESVVIPQAAQASESSSTKAMWFEVARLKLESADGQVSTIQGAVDTSGNDVDVRGAARTDCARGFRTIIASLADDQFNLAAVHLHKRPFADPSRRLALGAGRHYTTFHT